MRYRVSFIDGFAENKCINSLSVKRIVICVCVYDKKVRINITIEIIQGMYDGCVQFSHIVGKSLFFALV